VWIPQLVIEYLKISKEAVDDVRQELAVVRAERDALKVQVATTQSNFDWLRAKVNQLEFENKALIQKAYDIQLPVPELVRRNPSTDFLSNIDHGFNDIGEELARQLGLPSYDPSTDVK
jgi:predicted nuclease with TOPRIM domain